MDFVSSSGSQASFSHSGIMADINLRDLQMPNARASGEALAIATYDQVAAPVMSGDIEELSSVLSNSCVNWSGTNGDAENLLHLAITHGQFEALEILVNHAAGNTDALDARDREGNDVLSRVALLGKAPLVKVLIEAGARSMQYQGDALHSISDQDELPVARAKLLIAASGDVDKAFDFAMDNGRFDAIFWLSKNGADMGSIFKNYLSLDDAVIENMPRSRYLVHHELIARDDLEPIIRDVLISSDRKIRNRAQLAVKGTDFLEFIGKKYKEESKPLLFAATQFNINFKETCVAISRMYSRKITGDEYFEMQTDKTLEARVNAEIAALHNEKIEAIKFARPLYLTNRDFIIKADEVIRNNGTLYTAELLRDAGANISNKDLNYIFWSFIVEETNGTWDNVKALVGGMYDASYIFEKGGRKSTNTNFHTVAYEFIKQKILYNNDIDDEGKIELVRKCLNFGAGVKAAALTLKIDEWTDKHERDEKIDKENNKENNKGNDKKMDTEQILYKAGVRG